MSHDIISVVNLEMRRHILPFHRPYHDSTQPQTARKSTGSIFPPDVASAGSAAAYTYGTIIAQTNGLPGILVYLPHHSGGITPPNSIGITGYSHWFFAAKAFTSDDHGMFYPKEAVKLNFGNGRWHVTGQVNVK